MLKQAPDGDRPTNGFPTQKRIVWAQAPGYPKDGGGTYALLKRMGSVGGSIG
jgi:hypothetical protein